MKIFNLPDLGEGLHDVEIIEWHVAPGDWVEAGQTLASVETDKAVVDIPAPYAGRITQIFGAEGSHLSVGAPLAQFEDRDKEETGAIVGTVSGQRKSGKPTEKMRAAATQGTVKALPAIRARARELGVDLSAVTPTGSEGQVTDADLERAIAEKSGGAGESLRGPRRAMALNMARAHAQVVPATLTDDAAVPHWSGATDVTILLAKAIASAARESPSLNAWFDGAKLTRTRHTEVHIGIAVDTQDGLFVPVLRDAQKRSAHELREDFNRLKAEVAARTISRADLQGATFSLSNFGTIGGRYAALALLPPQVAILGAGAVVERVTPVDGKPAVQPVLPLSLTFDHRAVTGAEAARFLSVVINTLENSK